MYEHRNVQFRAQIPNRIEARIIDMDAPTLAVLQIHSEILKNLQPLRAIFDILLQLGRGAPAIIGIIDAREIEIGEDHEALWIPFFQDLDVFLQPVAVTRTQVLPDAEIASV